MLSIIRFIFLECQKTSVTFLVRYHHYPPRFPSLKTFNRLPFLTMSRSCRINLSLFSLSHFQRESHFHRFRVQLYIRHNVEYVLGSHARGKERVLGAELAVSVTGPEHKCRFSTFQD